MLFRSVPLPIADSTAAPVSPPRSAPFANVRLHVLTEQVSELQSERSAQDVRMQEERESAAKGMELLVMAQQNLSRAIQAAATEAPAANGNDGHSEPSRR